MGLRGTKRKWVSTQKSYGQRKRRFTRRRRPVRGRRTRANNYTSLSTVPRDRLIKRRPTRKRAWRRKLLMLTSAHPHYKSAGANGFTFATSASTNSSTYSVGNIFPYGTGSPFWTAAGGASSLTFGGTVPSFSDVSYIIMRGGRATLMISSPQTATSNIKVRVQFFFAKQQRQQAASLITSTNVPTTDWLAALPTPLVTGQTINAAIGDYDEYFHQPVFDKECILQVGESVNFERAVGTHRIDVDQFRRGGGWFPYFAIYATAIQPVVQNVQVQLSWDVSFTPLSF